VDQLAHGGAGLCGELDSERRRAAGRCGTGHGTSGGSGRRRVAGKLAYAWPYASDTMART
jgi:hypothetical protein